MISAIVLAGGESSRMGSPKPLLKLGNENFLETICSRLKTAGVDDIVVVLGGSAAQVLAEWRRNNETVAVNLQPQDGQISSLRVGLKKICYMADAVFICLVDTPAVDADTYKSMIAAWRQQKGGIVLPRFKGKHGHPVLLDHRYFDETMSCETEHGLHAVISANRAAIMDVDVDDEGTVFDIDTPEDYKQAVSKFKD